MYKKPIPLSVPFIAGNEWKYVKQCLDDSWVADGPFIGKFEQAVCAYTGAHYAVACANGTSGLLIALKLAGVESGDEVIVPTLTFIASVNTVRYLSAEPVFMDCDENMNMDPVKLALFCEKECRMTKKGLVNKKSGRTIKAIMPVHIFGNPCNMQKIMDIAKRYHLRVVEDAAESLGSYYTTGAYKKRYTGTIGDIGVFSFNGNKIITTGGGGMIVTNNKKYADKARYLINQAKDDTVRYIHNEIGYNYRMSNIQAAIGCAQIEKLDAYITAKKKNYMHYAQLLNAIEGITLAGIPSGTHPNYWLYTVLVDKKKYGMNREALMQCFSKHGIQTRPLWYLHHLQKPYRKNQAFEIEKAHWFFDRALNIPSSVQLTEDDIKRVAGIIARRG